MNRNRNTGFTLVELMLAMAALSILILAIVSIIIQIGTMYATGTTLKAINQSGRAVVKDVRVTLQAAQPQNVKANPNVSSRGGRLCTGEYTYVWNYGRALAVNSPVYTYATGTNKIRLVKVADPGASICVSGVTAIAPALAVELLDGDEQNLAVQNFSISIPPAALSADKRTALFKVMLEIGTNDAGSLEGGTYGGGISSDTTCKPPTVAVTPQEYCAVNRFEFTALTGNVEGGS